MNVEALAHWHYRATNKQTNKQTNKNTSKNKQTALKKSIGLAPDFGFWTFI